MDSTPVSHWGMFALEWPKTNRRDVLRRLNHSLATLRSKCLNHPPAPPPTLDQLTTAWLHQEKAAWRLQYVQLSFRAHLYNEAPRLWTVSQWVSEQLMTSLVSLNMLNPGEQKPNGWFGVIICNGVRMPPRFQSENPLLCPELHFMFAAALLKTPLAPFPPIAYRGSIVGADKWSFPYCFFYFSVMEDCLYSLHSMCHLASKQSEFPCKVFLFFI